MTIPQDALEDLTSAVALLNITNPAAFHSLPTELCIEIAGLCCPPGDDSLDDNTTPRGELERLAKSYLLKIAQVCSRWHDIVMCTPSLWSTIVVDTSLWPESSSSVRIGLVLAALDRSGSHPLRVEVAAAKTPDGIVVLELLSYHSSRWKTLNLWNDIPTLRPISFAKGNLPLLESAIISIQNDEWSDSIGVFQDAPLLTALTFTGWATLPPLLPWGQLRHFRYINVVADELADSLTLLSRLSPEAACDLELVIEDTVLPVDLPHISASLCRLALTFEVYREEPSDFLGPVLKSLTLPDLRSLSLLGEMRGSPQPLPWNQAEFIPFALRSGLGRTLLRLDIRAQCVARDLLQCLVHLPLLEDLILAEYDGDSSHVLISDELFLGLLAQMPGSDQFLVPRLRFVVLSSNLHFSDAPFWSFVEDRFRWMIRGDVPFDPTVMAFEVKLYWLSSCVRGLNSWFHEHVDKLRNDWTDEGFTMTVEPEDNLGFRYQ